jgi:glycosyltransferase involved in cell wall biosynthesis
MRILWFAHDAKMSGANICLAEFLEITNKNNIENHLLLPREGAMLETTRSKVKTFNFVKFYSWNWAIGSKPPLSFRIRRFIRNRKAVRDIERIINDVKPDFVVTNTIVAPVAAIAAKRSGVKHVWLIHEFGEEDHGYTVGGGFPKAARRMDKLSNRMAFVSKAIQTKYAPFISHEKMYTVYNAPNLKAAIANRAVSTKEVQVIMLGQIAPSKNQLEALKAVNICKARGVNISLNIYGKAEDSSYLESLEAFVKQEGLERWVHFKGVTTNPEQVLVQHDLLILCSRMEAFGRVTVEALQCGLPVIATRAGGSCEIIKEGFNGFLYQPGDPEDLADRIISFSKNPTIFDNGKIAFEINKRFNPSITTQQLLNVFS